MDTRTARRAAEKAARDLIATRAALVGELGVAAAERNQLTADITAATDRGRQLIATADAEAARLLAAAQDQAADGEQRYTDAYTAATAAGWAPADLTALGFPASPTSTPQHARRRRPTQTSAGDTGDTAATRGTADLTQVPRQPGGTTPATSPTGMTTDAVPTAADTAAP